MKKYELVAQNDSKLFRIRALRDFGLVKKGDLGGFIESENNLSHDGDCWVFDDAEISGHALVSGNAQISGYAIVSDHVKISGNAQVSGYAVISNHAKIFHNAKVSGYTQVFGHAYIYENAMAFDNSSIFNNAILSGNAVVSGNTVISEKASIKTICSKNPIYMNDFYYEVIITDNHIKIGCECHTIDEWSNFTDKEILAMGRKTALRFWKDYKVDILDAAALHRKKSDI